MAQEVAGKVGQKEAAIASSTPAKSFLPSALSRVSPWASSTDPSPGVRAASTSQIDVQRPDQMAEAESVPPQNKDAAPSKQQRVNASRYPKGCPPLSVQWFYASDFPKRKPNLSGQPITDPKPMKPSVKYAAFSLQDSKAIETAFQEVCDRDEATTEKDSVSVVGDGDLSVGKGPKPNSSAKDGSAKRTHEGQIKPTPEEESVLVPVNEDYLFDVDIRKRELLPTYWLGPVFEVRRGSWFYPDGKPCEENLSLQLEEGYIQAKAWTITGDNVKRRSLQPGSVSTERRSSGSAMSEDEGKAKKSNAKDKRTQTELEASSKSLTLPNLQNQRLFGQYMSSMVTYQDATTAWLMSDDFFARMSSTVYQRFAGGAHMSGTKLTRGHNNAVKSKEQAPKPKADSTAADSVGNDRPEEADVTEQKPSPAQRKLFETASRAKESAGSGKAAPSEEEQDGSMLEDYRDTHGEDQARPIDHLLFVTHGIGQKLGLRMESVNFIHDCNNLRKTLKAVYASSADLQALNSEDGKTPGNCRVQVLPVCWRHMLDFPKSAVKHNRGESDIGTGGEAQEDEKYPSLADITVEGVPAVRSLISDLGLDILLYQSAYRDLIATNVLRECNRIHDLFCKRNPEFKGKVSLVGHSLGSAIFFDILCDQKDKAPVKIVKKSSWTHRRSVSERPAKHHPNDLKFPVENMFSLGSPIGLFQMLKGRTIAARACKRDDVNATSTTGNTPETSNAFSVTVSSPKVGQFFNIFHPTDPIAYRIEPLISTAMATLKPQPIPYTKKGLFDAQIGQLGLGQIGARVGSSVSNLWSSMTTNIASNVLNRSLGFTGEAGGYHTGETATASRMSLVQPPGQPGGAAALSAGAGTNILGGGVLSPDPPAGSGSDDKKRALAERTMQGGGRRDGVDAKTLIDDEIETLYSGFQKRGKKERSRSRARDTSEAEADASLKEVMLRREERKVKALNSTGRVDFSIQERFYDISLLQSIASHLAYWQDEDVWHLALGQMLSKHQASGDQGLREELDRFEAKRP